MPTNSDSNGIDQNRKAKPELVEIATIDSRPPVSAGIRRPTDYPFSPTARISNLINWPRFFVGPDGRAGVAAEHLRSG